MAVELNEEQAAIAELGAILLANWGKSTPIPGAERKSARLRREIAEEERRADGGTLWNPRTDWERDAQYQQDLTERFS